MKEYYKRNVMFFLVVIVITCGFMSGVEHQAIAEFFISTPVTLSIPFVIWLLYVLKVIRFNTQSLDLDCNTFMNHLLLCSRKDLIGAVYIMLTSQMMPVLIYGAFLFLTAVRYSLWWIGAEVLFMLAVLLVTGTIAMITKINRLGHEVKISVFKNFYDKLFTKPLVQFYLEFILRKDFTLFAGTKVFCVLLIFAVERLYLFDDYDWRLLGLGVIIAFIGNFMLIRSVHQFETTHFKTLRNMPFNRINVVLRFCIIFICLTLPELLILIRNFPLQLNLSDGLTVYLMGLSTCVLNYGWLYKSKTIGISSHSWLLLNIIGAMILILFAIPPLALALTWSVFGAWMFLTNYYGFEPQADVT